MIETEAPPPAASAEAQPQTICPMDEKPCEKGCSLPAYTGRTYCVKWITVQRAVGN